jgi:hypothetical protein
MHLKQSKIFINIVFCISSMLLLSFCTTQRTATKSGSTKPAVAPVPADTVTYDKASPFVDSFARVEKDSSSFYINEKGGHAFDRIIHSFHPLDSVTATRPGYVKLHRNKAKRMRIVVKNQKYGMVNEQGAWVFKPTYDSLSYAFKRYIEVHKEGKMTYADSWGKLLVPLKFQDVGILDGERYDVERNGKWGVYDTSHDKMVIPFEYDKFDYCGGCGSGSDYVYAKKDGKWGVVNFNNQVLVPFKYEHQHVNMRSDDWVTAFQKNGANVVVNIPLQKEYGPPEFSAPEIINGKLVVKKNDKFGLIGADGEQITDFTYDDIWDPYGSFKSGPYVSVKKDGRYGMINQLGDTIIPADYQHQVVPRGDYFIFEKNDKKGLLNKENNVILPAEYDQIYEDKISLGKNHQEVIFGLINGDQYGFYFPKTTKLVAPKFDRITFFNKKRLTPYGAHPAGLLEVEINDKDKLYDLNTGRIIPGDYSKYELKPHHTVALLNENYEVGLHDLTRKKQLIPIKYKSLKVYDDHTGVVKVQKDIGNYQTHSGLFDLQGKEVLPVEYDEIKQLDKQHFLLSKKGGPFYIWNSATQKKEKLPFNYVTPNDSTSLLTVRKDTKAFLYDYKKQKRRLKQGYTSIVQLKNDYFYVAQKDSANRSTYGYANPEGKLIVSVNYDAKSDAYLPNFDNQRYLPLYKITSDQSSFSTTQYQGFASLQGNILVPPSYQKVYPEKNGHGFLTKKNNRFGVIDARGNEILPAKYNVVLNRAFRSFINTATFNFPLLFGTEGHWQYIDKEGHRLPVKAHGYFNFKPIKRY